MLLSSDRDVSKILKMKKILFLKIAKGPIIFSVCVWGGGGGASEFWEGEQKKADLIKGGIKFGRNMVRGKRNYEFVQGGIRFLIIWMYNKVLNGQSKPCLQDLLSLYQNNIMPNNCQCHIHFSVCSRFFVERASQAFLWYSQFFSESELRFSRNYYVIIPF